MLCLLDENSYDEALSDEVWKAITNAGIDLKEDGTLKFLEHTEEVSLLHSLFIVPSLESLKTILLTLLKLAKIKMCCSLLACKIFQIKYNKTRE